MFERSFLCVSLIFHMEPDPVDAMVSRYVAPAFSARWPSHSEPHLNPVKRVGSFLMLQAPSIAEDLHLCWLKPLPKQQASQKPHDKHAPGM